MATHAVEAITGTGFTTAIPVNQNASGSLPVGLLLDFATGTGSATIDVQFTFDDPASATAVWFVFANLGAKSATIYDNPILPVRAVRAHCTAYVSGTVYFRVFQGNNYVES